jgi:hypothetical protein
MGEGACRDDAPMLSKLSLKELELLYLWLGLPLALLDPDRGDLPMLPLGVLLLLPSGGVADRAGEREEEEAKELSRGLPWDCASSQVFMSRGAASSSTSLSSSGKSPLNLYLFEKSSPCPPPKGSTAGEPSKLEAPGLLLVLLLLALLLALPGLLLALALGLLPPGLLPFIKLLRLPRLSALSFKLVLAVAGLERLLALLALAEAEPGDRRGERPSSLLLLLLSLLIPLPLRLSSSSPSATAS